MIIKPSFKLFDSNLLISFFLGDKHKKKIEKLIQSGCYINKEVITETLNFIQKNDSAYRSLNSAKLLFSAPLIFPILDSTEEDQDKAIVIMEKYLDNNLSFVDSLILAQAERHKLEVFTTDARMANYKRVKVTNPIIK